MRIRFLSELVRVGVALLLAIGCCQVRADEGVPASEQKLWEQLKQAVLQNSSVAAEARTRSVELLEQGGNSAITSALVALHPGYAAAVSAADEGDPETALALLGPLSSGATDPWLRADASWYMGRTLMNAERFEEALPLLQQLAEPMSEHSAHQAEVSYYMAACHAGMLQTDLAVHAFSSFLEQYPDASERLRVSAWTQLQTIQETTDPKMSAVTTRMDYSRRRLDISEAGEQTQSEQDRIVKLLAEMIQEQQKKECSSGSCNKSGTKKQQEQQAKKENSPQKPSESKKGGNSNVANGEAVEKSFDNGDASPWSRLRDRSRDSANSAIKEKLPARYREIVERYTDAVSGNDPKANAPDGAGSSSSGGNR